MSSLTVPVSFGSQERQYAIHIGNGILGQLGIFLETCFTALPKKALIVSDSTVWPLYGVQVEASLEKIGLSVEHLVIPAGETSKTLETATHVYDAALRQGLSRKDVMIALGGGVVGDLTGYCAATYYRGMPFVQIPTTLLAQVDSSVGGKVAVNYQDVKNGIGAFYQPSLVLVDLEVLHTLPRRELLAGLAEIVKYALIEQTALGTETPASETTFFQFFEAHTHDWENHLSTIVARCCNMKAVVVKRDETEQLSQTASGRICLNLGHTFAHAYEALTNYSEFLHGEAVAIGMIQACETSTLMGLIPPEMLVRVKALFEALSLPVRPPRVFPAENLLRLMRKDKKASNSQLTLILPEKTLGTVTLVPNALEDTVRSVLAIH
jgi:3-dehydroquinate synthase